MSQLALTRLVAANNRSAWRRLIGIAAGVMVGVALFLLLAGASQGFEDRSLRSTWKEITLGSDKVELTAENLDLSDDEAAAGPIVDYYLDNPIQGISLATTTNTSMHIPGADVVPRPGEYLASPALAELIDSAPGGVLADRYGTRVGTIGRAGLEGPDALVLVLGTTTTDLLAAGEGFGATPLVFSEFPRFDYASDLYRTVALIGAIAVLIPVLLLIAIVTDLGAAQRAERFASLRLVGATPQQVARIGAIETGLTTTVGATLGVGLYFAVVPAAALLRIGSSRFYASDLLVSVPMMIAVVLFTILGATFVSWWRIRRADIGPLGASRERQEHQPRLIALLPLITGLSVLAFAMILHRREIDSGSLLKLIVAGFTLTAFGLLWAGPILTWWTALVGQNNAHMTAQVISFSRIAKHPRSAFRAVAGVVIATFTVTVFAVAITAAAGINEIHTDDGRLSATTLIAPLQGGPDLAEVQAKAAQVAASPGVDATAFASLGPDGKLLMNAEDAVRLGLNLDGIGTEYVLVNFDYIIDAPPLVEAAAGIDASMLVPAILFVTTNGNPEDIEQARTAIVDSGVGLSTFPTTRGDIAAMSGLAMENQFAALGYIGIIIATALSAISLAVSTTAALLNRKRVFGLLKLVGMPQRTLRSIVSWETGIPSVTVLIVSIGLGWYSAWAIISTLSTRRIGWPSLGYYLVLATCLIFIYLATAAASRAARTMTGNSVTRFE